MDLDRKEPPNVDERFDVIVLTAGKGVRPKNGTSKQFLPLCGKPILIYTLDCDFPMQYGYRVRLAPGNKTSIKIATPRDLIVAEVIMQNPRIALEEGL